MRRPLRTGVGLGLAGAVAFAGLQLVDGIGGFLSNPLSELFRSERREQVEPAVLHALRDADELRAATAQLEVIVEIEDDTRFVPDFLSGQQATFLAAGAVDATVDLGEARVKMADNGDVVVSLPSPVVDGVRFDHDRSRILDRDRGLFDRVGDVFTDNPSDDSDLYLLAEGQLRRAAAEGELLERAESSAKRTVEQLLADSGVGEVTVVFATPAVPDGR